ncbi:MAG: hypothetical protein QXQ66_07840 [Candidatus Hadarchaeum sp.]|uniref:hypothetical protein n=1 Tax=Candidatus Hadarchaeum sp. TaxID=2883567 RepID=UPI00317F3E26
MRQGDEATDQSGRGFRGEEAAEKLLYMAFRRLNERVEGRKLKNCAEICLGSATRLRHNK